MSSGKPWRSASGHGIVPAMEDKRPRRRPIRKLTPERLENAALHYLERYASSAENLRRVLLRRVERAARLADQAHSDQERTEPMRWVDAIVKRYVASGLLNDRAYAEAASASLRRQGRSARAIRQKLATKGIGREAAEAALIETDGADAAAELRAAMALARKRRLGPFGPAGQRRERRARDLASLARAGFSYDTARRVIDAREDELIER